MSPLQDRLTFNNSLPKAEFSVTFSRVLCTNNTQAKHELRATILQMHSEYFFPLHNSGAPCVLPSAFLLLFCKHFINHSPRLLLSHKRHLFQPAAPENQARWTLIRRRQDSTTGWQRQKHCSVIKLVNCWSPHGAQMELTEPPGWTTIYQCYVLYPFSRLNWPLLSPALFICFTTGYLHRLTFKFKNRQPKKRRPLFRRGEKNPQFPNPPSTSHDCCYLCSWL